MIAALFVDPHGCYANLKDVDLWDKERDARLYSGPYPVVAHPPCNLWVNMSGVNYIRYRGVHNRPGNDQGCFCRALESVRKWGGVLEHPAGSFAWSTFYLDKPSGYGWSRSKCGGWVCEVYQTAYGHKAMKKTWLYYFGSPKPFDLDWGRRPGSHQIGWFDRKKPTLGKKAASATPIDFRDELISLAEWSTNSIIVEGWPLA